MNQKGFVAFIVIAVFFGIIIGTGLIWYQQSHEETQSENTTDLVTDSSEKQLTPIEIKIHQYSSNPDLVGDLLTLGSKTSFKNVKVEENGSNSVQVSSDDEGALFISAGKSESGGVHEYIPDAVILDNEALGIRIYRINSQYESLVYKEYVDDNSEDNYSYYVKVGDADLGCNSSATNYCGPQELDLEQANIVIYCQGNSSIEIEFCDEIVSSLEVEKIEKLDNDKVVDVSTGLMIHYTFDGNLYDSSGNGYDAESVEANFIDDHSGEPSASLDIQKGQYIEIPAVINLWEAPWTLSMLLNIDPSEPSEGNYPRILFSYAEPDILSDNYGKDIQSYTPNFSTYLGVLTRNNNRDENYFYFQDALSKGAGFEYWEGVLKPNINGSDYLDSTNWYHVTLVYNESGLEVYINGQPIGLVKSQNEDIGRFTIRHQATKYYLGFPDVSDWQTPFAGKIDEFRLYDRALNEIEIEELYNNL